MWTTRLACPLAGHIAPSPVERPASTEGFHFPGGAVEGRVRLNRRAHSAHLDDGQTDRMVDRFAGVVNAERSHPVARDHCFRDDCYDNRAPYDRYGHS